LSVYFDASILVSMFVSGALSARADAYILDHKPAAVVSSLAAAEVASALGVKIRRGEIDVPRARGSFAAFDAWRSRAAAVCEVTDADVLVANSHLRRLDLPLRTADAIHLAIAERLRTPIATFDAQIMASALALGLSLAPT
jgi:predicted nucleic acid-binding protein